MPIGDYLREVAIHMESNNTDLTKEKPVRNLISKPIIPEDLIKLLEWTPAHGVLDEFMQKYSPDTFEECQAFYGDRGYKLIWEKFKRNT